MYRVLDGREYLHVHRKINKSETNRFINVTGLSGKSLALKKYEANQIDKDLAELQVGNNQSVMAKFSHPNGKLKHIIIAPPQKKSGWSVKCVISQNNNVVLNKSLSITKHTLEKAIKMMFAIVAKFFGISKRSATYKVLLALYSLQLSQRYAELKAESD